jgi:hypothetical protein
MSKNFEIAENPKILLDQNFDFKQIQIEGLKLNENYKSIQLINIVDIYVEDCDYLYDNFTKRLEHFEKHNGVIHMAGKIAFKIKNQKIDLIILRGKYIDKLKSYSSKEITNTFGKPDKILTNSISWLIDYVEYAKIYAYADRKIYFFFDEETKKIDEIQIGNFNEAFYDSN